MKRQVSLTEGRIRFHAPERDPEALVPMDDFDDAQVKLIRRKALVSCFWGAVIVCSANLLPWHHWVFSVLRLIGSAIGLWILYSCLWQSNGAHTELRRRGIEQNASDD